MKNNKPFVISLITFLIIIITTYIRYEDVVIEVPISYTLFLFMTWFLIYKGYTSTKQTFILFTLNLLILLILVMIIDGGLPTIGAPNAIATFLGTWSGCIIANKRAAIGVKLLIPIVVFAFSGWYINGGYNNYFNYLDDQGTFSGRTEKTMKGGWITYTKDRDTLNVDFYKDKIILLDFWNTSCGVCFKKFPDLERIYRKYQYHNDFVLQSVNIPIDRDTAGMAFHMIERYKQYTFPVVIGNEAMRSAFGVESYPTLILLKNGSIIFKGRMELVEKVLEEELSLVQ